MKEMFDSDLLNQLSEGVIVADQDGRLLFVNEAAHRMHGVRVLDIAPTNYSETYHLFMEDGAPYPSEQLPLSRAVLNGETIEEARWRIRRPDGTEIVAIGSARPMFNGTDQIGAILTIRDDSARYEVERALRESEARFRNMADHAPVMMWVTEPDGYCSYLNRGWYEFTGQTEEEALGFGWLKAVHPDDAAEAERAFVDASANAAPFRIEYRLRRADGVYRWAIDAASPRFEAEGQFLGFVGSVIDIDERREAENAIRDRELHLAAIVGQTAAGIAETDLTGRLISVNDRYCALVGRSREELLNLNMQNITHPDDLARNVSEFMRMIETGRPFEIEKRYVRPDGSNVWVNNNVSLIQPGGERPNSVLAVSIDISGSKAAEEALRVQGAEFEALAENVSQLAWMAEPDGAIFWYNKRWYDYTGTDLESMKDWGWRDVHHPDRIDAVIEEVTANWATGEAWEGTYLLRSAEGEFRWFLTRAEPIREQDGTLLRWFGTNTDVTAQLEAEKVLSSINETLELRVRQETAKRAETEEALRQSQKLETLGQLTGGVAHDFNNLLTPIVGALDVAQKSLADDPRAHRLVSGAIQAADRARTLVQRLLAFSRRQHLQPQSVDIAGLVQGVADLIRRSIGPHIELDIDIAPDLAPARVDPHQLELALINLAVNARDAMPDGGALTIRARREMLAGHEPLSDGAYIRLEIADTGTGMDDVTMARSIEPFFTTKDIGEGTGLGLSSVQGLALQSGGELALDSVVGSGTTATLWLPVSSDQPPRDTPASDTRPADRPADATALLVDDEPLVRAGVAAMLEDLGYRVIEAASADEAATLVDSGIAFDVLITDHAMPGRSGTDLAHDLRARRPDLPILLVTGYAKVAEDNSSGLDRLPKPFRQEDLAARLERLLAGTPT